MNITFDEFKKLDIRIGEIVSVGPIEESDKLLKLIVDLGEEKRQLVAGIAQYYKFDQLIGKQIPILCNLEPKVMRGVESQGMILACDENGAPVLLHPEKKVINGSIVR